MTAPKHCAQSYTLITDTFWPPSLIEKYTQQQNHTSKQKYGGHAYHVLPLPTIFDSSASYSSAHREPSSKSSSKTLRLTEPTCSILPIKLTMWGTSLRLYM